MQSPRSICGKSCNCFFPNMNRAQLKILNNVRIHLQVTYLADITTGDGKYVRRTILEARRQDNRISQLDWGIQHPSTAHLTIWKKAIATLTTNASGRLHSTLGNWINKPSWNEEWRWLESSETLAKKVSSGWNLYTPVISPNGLRSNKFSYSENVSNIQNNQAKATVSSIGIDLVQFEGCTNIDAYKTPSIYNKNKNIQMLNTWFAKTSQLNYPLSNILQALCENQCFFATDGSYMPDLDERRCSGS